MRTIANDKGSFTTQGNTNGVYNNMERGLGDHTKKSAAARARFDRKPWYVIAAEKLREMEDSNGNSNISDNS